MDLQNVYPLIHKIVNKDNIIPMTQSEMGYVIDETVLMILTKTKYLL